MAPAADTDLDGTDEQATLMAQRRAVSKASRARARSAANANAKAKAKAKAKARKATSSRRATRTSASPARTLREQLRKVVAPRPAPRLDPMVGGAVGGDPMGVPSMRLPPAEPVTLPQATAPTPTTAPGRSAQPAQPARPDAPAPRVDETRSRIAHLWRRAGFGARPEELDRATPLGYAAAVDRLLDSTAPDPAADVVAKPALTKAFSFDTGKDVEQRKAVDAEREALLLWWVQRMAAAGSPLSEKLAWFWHGHFATSAEKVWWPSLMDGQQQLFRTLGTGRLEPLVRAVTKDPAMVIWLDAGTSRLKAPNENYAREVMELFTLGVGSYSEADVRAAARALTGLRIDKPTASVIVNDKERDRGLKTILGQTGAFDPDGVVALITSQPASARFIAARVWSRFARPATVADPVVEELALSFQRHGSIGQLLREVFLHPAFVSPSVRTGLVKSPVEWAVGASRAFGLLPDKTLVNTLRGLGQLPFYPPNVGGWPTNEAWLGTGSSLNRLSYAQYLAGKADLAAVAATPVAARAALVARLLSVDGWSARTAAAMTKVATSPRDLVALALASPEYLRN